MTTTWKSKKPKYKDWNKNKDDTSINRENIFRNIVDTFKNKDTIYGINISRETLV